MQRHMVIVLLETCRKGRSNESCHGDSRRNVATLGDTRAGMTWWVIRPYLLMCVCVAAPASITRNEDLHGDPWCPISNWLPMVHSVLSGNECTLSRRIKDNSSHHNRINSDFGLSKFKYSNYIVHAGHVNDFHIATRGCTSYLLHRLITVAPLPHNTATYFRGSMTLSNLKLVAEI